jgi:hypothetical protein
MYCKKLLHIKNGSSAGNRLPIHRVMALLADDKAISGKATIFTQHNAIMIAANLILYLLNKKISMVYGIH